MMRRQHLFFCLMLWMSMIISPVYGQEETARPPAPPMAEASAQEGKPDAPGNESSAPRPSEHVIYVPFEVLEGTFERPDANVVLPYAEYIKLRRQWEKSQQPRSAPGAVITRAEYVATVEQDLARIVGTLTINVLGDAWSEVPLRFGEAAVAGIQGDQVLLRGIGDGEYSLMLGKTGEQTVTIELAARVSQSPTGRELQFAVPQVGVSTLDLIVPESDQTIEVLPRLLMQPTDNPDPGTTRIKASLGSTSQVTAKWHPRTSLKPEMELLTTVTNHTLVTIEDGLVHTDAYLTYDVLRGRLDLVAIAVPAGHRILDVSSTARMKSWKADMRDGQQVVTVELLGDNEKQVVIEVHTERKAADEALSVSGLPESGGAAGIHALESVRESGQIAIRHAADLAVAVAQQSGVVRIEQSELDPRLQGANAFAFKYFSPRLTLSVTAKPVEPLVNVVHNTALVFEEDELTLDASLAYTVERAGVFELVLKIPEDLTVDMVESPQLKEYVVDSAAHTLTVALNGRLVGGINLRVKGHRRFDANAETAEQVLPLLEPTGVEREIGTLHVFAKEAIEVITNQQGLVSAQPLQTGPGIRLGEAALASAWTFTRRPVTVPVRTIRKPTRLSATLATQIDVQPETTTVTTDLKFLVEYAGVDTFRFSVPESISERVQIDTVNADGNGPAIKQKTAGTAENGWVIWTVEMQREVLGTQHFKISYDVTPAAAEPSTAPTVPATTTDAAAGPITAPAQPALVIDAIRALGLVDSQGVESTPLVKVYGEVIVSKEQSLTLSANVAEDAAESIDIREVTLVPQSADQTAALAYRYYKQPDTGAVRIDLTTARNAVQEVVGTVVSRGLVEIVTAEDAQATFRARFHIKTVERQRLLVNLPSDIEVLGVFVDEREVKLEQAETAQAPADDNWSAYWVNVARTGDSDTPLLLTFQFLWTVNPPLGESNYGRGSMVLPLPVIGGQNTAVATQELRVVVWIPREFALVGDPQGFELEKRVTPWSFLLGASALDNTTGHESWLMNGGTCPTGYLMFPTEGRVPYTYHRIGGATSIEVMWWNRVANTIWLSAALALIGWILARTSWENKLGMLLLGGFAAILFGLRDSHTLAHGLSAARFGMAALIGLWVILGIAPRKRSLSNGRSRSESPLPLPLHIPGKPTSSTSTDARTIDPDPGEDQSPPPGPST